MDEQQKQDESCASAYVLVTTCDRQTLAKLSETHLSYNCEEWNVVGKLDSAAICLDRLLTYDSGH